MKKISIKASIAAVSLSLALTPLGFAQGPAVTQAATQATADTQPLPGAKVAGLVTANNELTQNGVIVLGIIGAVAFAALLNASNNGNDFLFVPTTATTTSTR